jgi:hypothetical protein
VPEGLARLAVLIAVAISAPGCFDSVGPEPGSRLSAVRIFLLALVDYSFSWALVCRQLPASLLRL